MKRSTAFGVLVMCLTSMASAQVPATRSTTSAATVPATRPVVITVDTSDAPELAAYAERIKTLAQEWYPKIAAALPSEGFTPADHVTISFPSDYKGIAAASGNRIIGSIVYFKAHPDDVGAFIHEMAHVVQHYSRGKRPLWLSEGIADYVRFYLYEPEENRPKPNPAKAAFSDSYRTTAHFLDWAQRTYDPQLVVKLNKACRTDNYADALWQEMTGKTLDELGAAWKASLEPR